MDQTELLHLTPNDFDEVRNFYWELIDQIKDLDYVPGWEKGVYPADAFLKDSLNKGELYILKQDQRIVAAVVCNYQCNEGYLGTQWKTDATDEEVLVIHALGVLPECHHQGLAKRMVREAIRIARENHLRAIRLDVLDGNLPALKLYEGFGFEYRRKVRMFYEDTGWTDFLLYELVMQKAPVK